MSVRQEFYARARIAAGQRPELVLVDDDRLAWSRWPVQQMAARMASVGEYSWTFGDPPVFNGLNTRTAWPVAPRMLDVLRLTTVTSRTDPVGPVMFSLAFSHTGLCAGVGLTPLISAVLGGSLNRDWWIPPAARNQQFTTQSVIFVPGPILTTPVISGGFVLGLTGEAGPTRFNWASIGAGSIISAELEWLNREDEAPALTVPRTANINATIPGGGKQAAVEDYAGALTIPPPPGGSKVIQVTAGITLNMTSPFHGVAGVVFGAAGRVQAGQMDNTVGGVQVVSATKTVQFKTPFTNSDYAARRATTPAHINFTASLNPDAVPGSATLNSISLAWVNP